MAADEKGASKKTAEEDKFTKASAIAASRSIAGVSPHLMAGALWELSDDDPVTRDEAAEAVARVSERKDD